MPSLKKSRFTVGVPFADADEELIALYQTMTGAFVLVPERTWAYMLTDPVAPADPATMDMLCEEGFLIQDCVDETALFDNWKQQHVHDFSSLQSRVLVTRRCNNRCGYCIIDPEARDMSPQAARAMDRFYIDVIEEKKPERVEDTYLGGEPLLRPEIILDSASRRFYYCQGKGVEYGFTVLTNGTLIREDVIQDMKAFGLSDLRVSIAGPAPIHDLLRPSMDNGKTYDLILSNLEAVTDLIPINIECQYDSGSQDFLAIPEMLDDFAARGIAVDDVAFTPILRRRGRNPHDSGMGDPAVFLYLKREAEKRGFPTSTEPASNVCMAEFRSRFVFDTDGSIIPCPSLQGGELTYGDITRGVDFVSESQLLQRSLPDKCIKKCALLPLCMGGCRLQALVAKGDFSGIDCHYDTYMLLLEDYIRQQVAEVSSGQESAELRKAA